MSERKFREGQSAVDGVRQKIKERLKSDDSRVTVAVSSGKTQQSREVGETWVDDDGHRWIQQQGFREKVSKLQSARIPLWCPQCKQIMNHRWDTKMYYVHGKCFNCVIKMEGEMRRAGTWEAHEKKVLRGREIGYLKDFLVELREARNTVSVAEFATGVGAIESWDVDVEQIKQDLETDILKYEARLKELEDQEHDS